jgi:hypothetical protein
LKEEWIHTTSPKFVALVCDGINGGRKENSDTLKWGPKRVHQQLFTMTSYTSSNDYNLWCHYFKLLLLNMKLFFWTDIVSPYAFWSLFVRFELLHSFVLCLKLNYIWRSDWALKNPQWFFKPWLLATDTNYN